MRHLLIFLLVILSFNGMTQATEKYQSPLSAYFRAEDLFEKEQYSAARNEFRLFLTNYQGTKDDPYVVKAYYYEGISALELFSNDAIDLLEKFNRDYPESIYKNDIAFRIGRYYYQKKDYDKAIAYFDQLDKSDVETTNLDEFHFKLGYANFHEKRYPAAKSAFFEVKESSSQYGAPSLYYYSHICYLDSSYQSALEGFERLMNDSRFKTVVPYYITQIYHMQGKYEEVVRFAPSNMDSLKPAEKVEMNHIIGDAFYRLGKYDEAVPFLEYYNEKSNTTRDDDYALAVAYWKSSNCTKAVKYFDKVARIKDTLGQIALYHAGECYINLNQLVYARTAFEAASELDMDALIQEDALYNYAILSYKLDMNAYDEAVEALELYLQKYPDSPRKSVVYQYLVNVYTSTKNYSKALASLDKIPSKDIKLKSAYQIIAFNRGVELFLNSDYTNAIKSFELVEKYPVSQEVSAKATFWTADAEYRLKNYSKSIQQYDALLAMPSAYISGLRPDAYYNKGYVYLALKDYPRTRESFSNYLKETKLTDKRKKADAHMRLADEYYRTKEDDLAIQNYRAALDLKSGFEDQALYYMARCYGFKGNRDEKIKALLDIINNYNGSKYTQSAVYEVAQTYYGAGNIDKADRYYQQIISDYPNSALVKEAYHNLGNIAYKRGQYDQAEKHYKKVLNDFVINDSICRREVSALADVYRRQGTINKIEQLSSLYSCADSISKSVEDEYYMRAYALYEDSAYTKALTEFDFYLNKYPAGKYRKDALYYKAAILYANKREEEAIVLYREILEGPDNDYTELSAQRSAKFLYNAKKYEEALPYYERLERVTTRPEFLNNARIGQMRCHFILENFANAADYAKKVLAIQQSTEMKLEAEYIRGISLAKTNNFNEALPSLEYVVKNTTKITAAESKYVIAEGYYKKPDLTKSEATIRELLKMKPGYDYWIAKGLILQTRILIQNKDLFQAENTIKSVIDHYPVTDDGIQTEAGELYDEIMQLKSQPKVIQSPDQNTVIEIEDNSGN
jgi:tetratricopeptide (TPR) repeat protein